MFFKSIVKRSLSSLNNNEDKRRDARLYLPPRHLHWLYPSRFSTVFREKPRGMPNILDVIAPRVGNRRRRRAGRFDQASSMNSEDTVQTLVASPTHSLTGTHVNQILVDAGTPAPRDLPDALLKEPTLKRSRAEPVLTPVPETPVSPTWGDISCFDDWSLFGMSASEVARWRPSPISFSQR